MTRAVPAQAAAPRPPAGRPFRGAGPSRAQTGEPGLAPPTLVDAYRRSMRRAAIGCGAVAVGLLALLLQSGCADTTVGSRDCHLVNLYIVRGQKSLDALRAALKQPRMIAAASPATDTVFVPADRPDLLGHEIDHLCARNQRENREIDDRDGWK